MSYRLVCNCIVGSTGSSVMRRTDHQYTDSPPRFIAILIYDLFKEIAMSKATRWTSPVIELISGAEGPYLSFALPDRWGIRFAGSQPWGCGTVTHTWRARRKDIMGAITAIDEELGKDNW